MSLARCPRKEVHMAATDNRTSRVRGDGGAGDAGDHGPEERTARDGEDSAPASDAERARGVDARSPGGRPAPPPREGEEPDAADRDRAAEEFRDDA
jgi:hypothetical protein